MIIEQLITYTFNLLIVYITALPYENEYGPEYGDEWIMVYDDKGNSHVMNFSTVPNDTRGLVFGDTYFYLYTRNNDKPEELLIPGNNKVFTSQNFNFSNAIKVATHGWFGNGQNKWLLDIKDQLLIKDHFNVIIIDWYEIAINPAYPWAAFSTRYVGKKTAKLLDSITAAYQINSPDIHLIGHSLGAQVMAYTALFSNQSIRRITGLDPARPFFELPMMPEDHRLDKTDAEFVDIIHSCGGIYGYEKSHGHADFYPNNGRALQPGCSGIQKVIEACSHGRACMFFEESINIKPLFKAYNCESWEKFTRGECNDTFTYMGYQAKTGDTGNYYLYTNSESPFAKGDDQNLERRK